AGSESRTNFYWDDMDRYVLHQISDLHTNAFVEAIGIPRDKVPTTYQRFGNVGPASIPITLADEVASGGIRRGDRVFLGGVGSGINTAMMELHW
ncbi:3-oxoacyl-[acyl-carrier-protein] synthase III C-terminal domain-containing protein, partial [Pseudomonas viridiflava]|uniref:3-oxoacyl-[acyl-carrier-protein] synthase III C-terminal domain-containing protein n=1 Tax=Pseudomonas viridiflava TaxID=33069 RepID=UPI002406FF69